MLAQNKGSLLFLCLLLVSFCLGCGGGDDGGDSGESLYETMNAPAGNNGSVGDGSSGDETQPQQADVEMLSEAARKAAEYLNGMTAEYEGFFGSGQSSVQLKRTEEMYQKISPVSQRVSQSAAPTAEQARELKKSVLPQLLDAIKRADLAELHFHREYSTNSFGMSPFGNSGHEIGDGIRAARSVLAKIQTNLPAAEKLTTGPPPTIGGPPPINRSYGYLQSVSLAPDQFTRHSMRGNSGGMVPWKMRLDPPVEPYQIEPETEIDFDAPHGNLQPSAFYNPVNLIYPAMASTHVGIGINEVKANQRVIWSLNPRLRKGIVKGIQLQKSDLMALSVDGMYFAGRPENTNIIGLFDVKKREAIGQVEHEFAVGSTPQLLFGVENRLVLLDGKTINVWSTPDLKLEHQIEVESPGPFMSRYPGYDWSISPGGRYLALPGYLSWENDIRFYDLTTGKTAASIKLAGYNHVRYVAVSFSKDGKKLAILMEGPWNSWVQIWDVLAGRLTASYTIDTDLSDEVKGDSKYQGPSIDWFPEGRYVLLYGKGIFDTETGQGIKLIPNTVRYPIKPIGQNQIAVFGNKKYTGYDLDQIPDKPSRWKAEALKSETMNADNPFAVVPEGAKPAPLATDRSGIEYVELPESASWNVTADAGPTQTHQQVSVQNFSSQHVYHTDVSADQSRFVAGMTSEAVRLWSGKISNADKMKTWIEFADLGSTTTPQKFDLKFASGLLAVSPSGQKVLTKDFDGLNRFDIWDLNSRQHVAGYIPYAQGRTDGGAPIVWGTFLDEDRVLTLSANQLTCWDTSNGAAIYEVEISNVAAWPEFSPGRQQLAILHEGKLTVLSTSNGEVIGHNPNLGLNGQLKAISYRQDGQELAVLSAPVGGGELGLVSITTGEVTKAFPIPATGKVLEWCGNDYVLIDGGYCVSLEKNAIAWIYNLDGVRVKSGSGTSKLFLAKTAYNKPHTLMSAQLPTQETLSALAAQDPPNDVVLAAGGAIAMDIQVMSPPNRGNFSEEVRTALAHQLSMNEISVAPAAPLTLVVRGSHGKTGDGISIGSFGSFSNRSEIDEERVTWTLSIQQENQTLWQRSVSANNTGSIDLEDGVSGQAAASQAEQQLRDNMWKKAASALLNFKLPKYVFGPEAGSGLGKTRLGT